ncbi:hypothetical protein V1505DRAFT_381726 [Lipomyces doorenjongii]
MSNLCTSISRYALELVYSEVVKKLRRQGDESNNNRSCATQSRYLLPCSHRIQLGVPLDITDIHPRWRVHSVFPPLNIPWQHVDPGTLAVLKDPSVELPRKGRPKGTRMLQTSAEIVQHAADQMAKVRRCGSCHKAGHNRRKCPKLLNNQSQLVGENESRADEWQRKTRVPETMMKLVMVMQTMLILRQCGETYGH